MWIICPKWPFIGYFRPCMADKRTDYSTISNCNMCDIFMKPLVRVRSQPCGVTPHPSFRSLAPWWVEDQLMGSSVSVSSTRATFSSACLVRRRTFIFRIQFYTVQVPFVWPEMTIQEIRFFTQSYIFIICISLGRSTSDPSLTLTFWSDSSAVFIDAMYCCFSGFAACVGVAAGTWG